MRLGAPVVTESFGLCWLFAAQRENAPLDLGYVEFSYACRTRNKIRSISRESPRKKNFKKTLDSVVWYGVYNS